MLKKPQRKGNKNPADKNRGITPSRGGAENPGVVLAEQDYGCRPKSALTRLGLVDSYSPEGSALDVRAGRMVFQMVSA